MSFRQIKSIGRLVRWPNLLIIAISLLLLNYVIIAISWKQISFWVLFWGTLCIAAAGNIINDILDVKIDTINKPKRVVVGRVLTQQAAWRGYVLLNLLALGLALIGGEWGIGLFFLTAILLLYFYSKKWKKQALIGNLVVALLCALVIVEFWWIERSFLTIYWQTILLSYAAFAFLSTLARELVKDIEDVEGDQKMNCQTLPIQYGLATAQKGILLVLLLLFILLFWEGLFLYQNGLLLAFVYIMSCLIPWLFFLLYKTQKAKTKLDYTDLSGQLKRYMLLGLGLLLLV
ncbi:geranylgeranylglycerol-phosphate geranylgeranyltransferase [Aureispira anguillae]|uniref:Geranylgeranylglycerol-phosphate geranylgeranyltransferase n=1 Tax=Aureispira anguillae TaxID=2864201 RepID=A0A916DRE4_9BACT|nr:geranylgeranylglycerol-phosphate geranylgeranyltransferase [Aureispira anguillae]BDS10332.1 geranylgeranylglycerol-phosphate geranylgeranyltransferase [Aureispira anguillae]